MKASILDLRRKTSEVIRALDRNESVTIYYRGKKKGILVPMENTSMKANPSKGHSAFGIWKDRSNMKDVNRFVRNLREGRISDI
ncbi:MAG: type II toxin-antitoxin system Phd/YefM family antitoxin [Candidatus Anammoxibacter sp.]